MSSDYVFGGDKGEPYLEYDEPNPVNYYGWTKLIGEQIVAKRLKRSFIVRTCGLYGPKGKNFVATVLLKARQGETLKMVSDQWVSPTYTADIVPFLFELSHSKYYGIYHLTNQGCITWYEFAKEILKRSRRPYELWEVSSEELGRPARRPRFSALKNQNFEVVFGHQPREWTSALEDYLKDTGQG
jgi:dTDP-4-dehydrorhamnose reductase